MMKLRLIEQLEPSDTLSNDKLTCLDFHRFPTEQLHMVFVGTELGHLLVWMWNLAQSNAVLASQRHHSQVLAAPEDRPMGRINALVCIAAPSDPAKCLVFAAGCGSNMHIWRISQVSSEHMQLLEGHASLVTGLADCKNGCIASCSLDGTIKLWAPVKEKDDEYACIGTVQGRPSSCLSWQNWGGPVAVNDFGDSHLWSCYVGAHDGSVVVYRRSAEAAHTSLEHHATWSDVHRQAMIRLVAVQSIHGSFLLSSSYDGSCKLVDGTSGMVCFEIVATQICSELRQAARYFTGVAWDDLSGLICVCDNTGTAQLWSPFRDKRIADFQVPGLDRREPRHGQPPCFVDLRLTDERVLYTLSDQGATYWHLDESSEQRFHGHEREVVAIQLPPPQFLFTRKVDAVSAAEGALFTAAADNKVCCWDEYDTELRYSLEDGRRSVTREISSMTVVWLHNTAVVGYDDGQLTFWNCSTRTRLTNQQHTDRITSLHVCCFGSNTVLLTAGADGCVGTWQLEPIRRSSQPLTMVSFQQPFESIRSLVVPEKDADTGSNVANECRGVAALTIHQNSLTVFAASDDGLVAYWHMNDNLNQIAANVALTLESVTSLACVEDLLIAGCSTGDVQVLRIGFEKPGKSRCPTLNHLTTISDTRRWQLSIGTLVAVRTPDGEAILIATLQGDTATLWRYEVSSGSCGQMLYQARYPTSNPSCLQLSFSTGASSIMAAAASVQGTTASTLARLFVGFEDGNVSRYHVRVR